MKKVLLLSLLSVFVFSCSTDFNVTADWKDITIAYGLLDITDTATYIKVNKAYLDPKTDALVIAQIADSLYYNNLDVRLEQYTNGNLQQTIALTKVDGNLEGYVKDTGIFANAPNWLYKTTQALDANSNYKMVITESDNGKEASASTEVVNSFIIQVPQSILKVRFFPGQEYKPLWTSAKDGKVYALTIRVHYIEKLNADPTQREEKSFDWSVFNSLRSNSLDGTESMSYAIPAELFYSEMEENIPQNPSVFRDSVTLDFMFSVGGEELDTYNQVLLAQQGLTSGTIEPEYTNIENGLGLFSSRYHKTVLGLALDPQTRDTLACGLTTNNLNFINSTGDPCN